MVSPTDKDCERYAETLYNADIENNIQDRDSFDLAFDQYFDGDLQMQENDRVKSKTFRKMRGLNPAISPTRLFTDAGGKSLSRDRQETAQEIVTTRKEYRKKGSSKVDLKGYDTKKRFTHAKRYKGRVIYTERSMFRIKGKEVTRFRGKDGRFV